MACEPPMIGRMIPEVVQQLRCPVCRQTLAIASGGLRCPDGHTFDRARQGYVHLLAGRAMSAGDSAEMVAARADFLAAGHYSPLAEALTELAAQHAPIEGLVVEVGAGTAYYLARVLEGLPGRHGLAVDLSKYAARRAAKAHPRVVSVVADASQPLPLAEGSAALVLDVFAPRNGAEFRRVLRPDGALLLVTPTPRHLAELRGVLGLLEVDPEKERRIAQALGPYFQRGPPVQCSWPLRLHHRDVARVVEMGPRPGTSTRPRSPDGSPRCPSPSP